MNICSSKIKFGINIYEMHFNQSIKMFYTLFMYINKINNLFMYVY